MHQMSDLGVYQFHKSELGQLDTTESHSLPPDASTREEHLSSGKVDPTWYYSWPFRCLYLGAWSIPQLSSGLTDVGDDVGPGLQGPFSNSIINPSVATEWQCKHLTPSHLDVISFGWRLKSSNCMNQLLSVLGNVPLNISSVILFSIFQLTLGPSTETCTILLVFRY